MTGSSDLDKLPHSIKILVLDWDNTITNKHMHSFFSARHYDWLDHPVHNYLAIEVPADYNSGKKKAVTEKDIENFLEMEGSGIKNAEQLKSVLQKALEQKVIVAIASFTNYPKAVEYVVQNHLGLSKEQAESIKVVGGLPPNQIRMEHRKNLHILIHILESLEKYKAKHDGALPQKVEVMLVDDDRGNVKCIESFNAQISQLLEFIKNDKDIQSLLKINSKTINTQFTAEDLKGIIELTGVQVPKDPITEIREEDKRKKHYGYLDEAEKWVKKKKVHFNDKVQASDITPNQNTDHKSHEVKQISNAQQQNRPQPWKKGLVIVAPAVIGLIVFGSLVKALSLSLSLPAVGIGVAIVALTVVVYVLEELLLKPELKPKSILKELGEKVKNFSAKKEKNPSCTIS